MNETNIIHHEEREENALKIFEEKVMSNFENTTNLLKEICSKIEKKDFDMVEFKEDREKMKNLMNEWEIMHIISDLLEKKDKDYSAKIKNIFSDQRCKQVGGYKLNDEKGRTSVKVENAKKVIENVAKIINDIDFKTKDEIKEMLVDVLKLPLISVGENIKKLLQSTDGDTIFNSSILNEN